MTAYGRMGWFCNLTTVPYWDKSTNKPNPTPAYGQQAGLTQFVGFLNDAKTDDRRIKAFDAAREIIRSGCDVQGVLDDMIPELLDAAAQSFTDALKPWRAEYDAILKAWKGENNHKGFANKLYHQLRVLADMTVIEVLANRRLLPRYGFPIDLHKLQVASTKGGTVDFKLERKSLQALREYVPGSKVMAGNRTIRSRGILKASVGENALGLHGKLAQCQNGHSFYTITPELGNCPYCNNAPASWPKNLLLPRNGYQTAVWDEPEYRYEPRMISYHCPIHVQFHEPTQTVTDFGGVSRLNAAWFKDGEILAIHDGAHRKGFAVCTICGYADSECSDNGEGREGLADGFAEHWTVNGFRKCWNDNSAPVLRHITLAAQQTTELLRLDFSPWLLRFGVPPHDAIIAALAAALKLAGARLLEIDVRELGMIEIFPAGEKGAGLGVLLYDDIPGGCGHVRDLMVHGKDWLEAARDLLHVNDSHHKACLHGCIDCILSAFSRENEIHPDRLGAYGLLNALLSGQQWQAPTIIPQQTTPEQPSSQSGSPGPSQNARRLRQKLRVLIADKNTMPMDKKAHKAMLDQLEKKQLTEEQISAELGRVQSQKV